MTFLAARLFRRSTREVTFPRCPSSRPPVHRRLSSDASIVVADTQNHVRRHAFFGRKPRTLRRICPPLGFLRTLTHRLNHLEVIGTLERPSRRLSHTATQFQLAPVRATRREIPRPRSSARRSSRAGRSGQAVRVSAASRPVPAGDRACRMTLAATLLFHDDLSTVLLPIDDRSACVRDRFEQPGGAEHDAGGRRGINAAVPDGPRRRSFGITCTSEWSNQVIRGPRQAPSTPASQPRGVSGTRSGSQPLPILGGLCLPQRGAARRRSDDPPDTRDGITVPARSDQQPGSSRNHFSQEQIGPQNLERGAFAVRSSIHVSRERQKKRVASTRTPPCFRQQVILTMSDRACRVTCSRPRSR